MPEDIHSLLAKYFSGQTSAEETDMVKKWAVASEENAADFRLLENLWNRSGEHQQEGFDTDKAWHMVNTRLQQPKQTRIIRLFARKAVVAAAAIILLLGAWWIFFSSGPVHTITADIAAREVNMEDGSKVFLRKGATIQYDKDYGKTNRNVQLDGEAFFEVQPDASKPFIIAAASTKVQVVGTSFLVNTNNNQVGLFVRTGRVNFSSGAHKVLVSAGENALYASSRLSTGKNSGNNFDAWRTKLLVFDKTLLKEAISDIANYYNINIRLKAGEEPAMESTTITARFNNQPLQAVLDELSMISTYRISRIDDTHYEISIK
jgi:transmembrane sensor